MEPNIPNRRTVVSRFLSNLGDTLLMSQNVIISGVTVIFLLYVLTYVDVTPTGKNPVIVWYTERNLRTGKQISWLPKPKQTTCFSRKLGFISCDIFPASKFQGNISGYIFFAPFIVDLPKRSNNTIWGIVNNQSPRDGLEFLHEKTWNLFNFTATFSRNSDVPITLPWLKYLNLITSRKFYYNTTKKNKFLGQISPILYLQSDCDTLTDRDGYVQKLMEYISIDSYGSCVNNRELPRGMNLFAIDAFQDMHLEDFLRFIGKYKFVIVIENSVCEDYISENLWRVISAGAVPIYFGDPLIKDWLPNNKSAVLLSDYPTPKLLSDHLYELLNDSKKYEEYLQHKIQREVANVRLIQLYCNGLFPFTFEMLMEKFYCQMCSAIHDRKDGEQHIASLEQYNCSMPISALTQSLDPNNTYMNKIEEAKNKFG